LDVPPTQSIVTDPDDPEDDPLELKVTGVEGGGLKTVTFETIGVERSAAVRVVCNCCPLTKTVV
jgi:hypothetical protein